MRVLLIGDVHGQIKGLADFLIYAKNPFRIGAAIQVGDFGFFSDKLLQKNEGSVPFVVPLHVIDGNHEDHEWLTNEAENGNLKWWEKEWNLVYQRRPSVIQIGSSKIGFLGGALNVDRPQKMNESRSISNFIQKKQREHAVRLFNQEKPDLIVTHTCPSGIGIGMRTNDRFHQEILDYIISVGFDPGPKNDCGDTELNILWQQLAYKPRAWVFGHFHQFHEVCVQGTNFICAANFAPSLFFPLLIWDSEEKNVYVIHRNA